MFVANYSLLQEASHVSVNEVKNADGACYLELKVPSRTRDPQNIWGFLEKYGYRYGQNPRPLLPSEVRLIIYFYLICFKIMILKG